MSAMLSDVFPMALAPPVRVADRDHRAEDVLPRPRIHHGLVGEHAAVPADVSKRARHLAVVAACPADLACGGEPLAEIFSDVTCLAKRVGDLLRVAGWILGPFARACGGIDPHDAVLSNAGIAELLRNRAGFSHLRDELSPL